MESHGFVFVALASGKSSGGWSASGEFRRERDGELRRLELHFRHSLGLVSDHVDGTSLSHNDYMRALKAKNQDPGFSHDPLDGFRHLLHDLEHPRHRLPRGYQRPVRALRPGGRTLQRAPRLQATLRSRLTQRRLRRHERPPDLHRPTFFDGDPPTSFDGA